MAGRKVYAGSNLSFSLQNDGLSRSDEPFDALLISSSSSPFTGMGSMVNFEDVCGRNNTRGMSFQRPRDQEEDGDDDMDDGLRHPEKKRRLNVDQVQFLERSFEVDNKLEPERKTQLAKDLGLHPRQVAIWFQNRRARWKTKQLEKDYEALRVSYNSLKSNYENLLEEKEELKAEILRLTDTGLQIENTIGNSETSGPVEPSQPESQPNSVSEKQTSKLIIVKCKQEDISSANSGVFDSDSPRYPNAVNSSLLKPADSSHAFEPDQSDVSQDEEDSLSKSLGHPLYNFPKLEYPAYPDLSANCSNYDFPVEDQTFWFWPYAE